MRIVRPAANPRPDCVLTRPHSFNTTAEIFLGDLSISGLAVRRDIEGRQEVMPQYLVAIHHPDDYDPSKEDAAMHRDIDVLNDEMKAAGVRVFVGGLQSASRAKSLRVRRNGEVHITDGPFIESKEHVGGFWVLDAADLDEALVWGRKAALACRAPVEVRQFHQMQEAR